MLRNTPWVVFLLFALREGFKVVLEFDILILLTFLWKGLISPSKVKTTILNIVTPRCVTLRNWNFVSLTYVRKEKFSLFLDQCVVLILNRFSTYLPDQIFRYR